MSYTIPATLAAIGEERLAWLRVLPRRWSDGNLCVVHAGPDDVWQLTKMDGSDEELNAVFGPLEANRVVYGHIHVPFVRRLPAFILANSGAVSRVIRRRSASRLRTC